MPRLPARISCLAASQQAHARPVRFVVTHQHDVQDRARAAAEAARLREVARLRGEGYSVVRWIVVHPKSPAPL
jgi:hypothetical protein